MKLRPSESRTIARAADASRGAIGAIALILLSFVFSCSSPLPSRPVTVQEQIRKDSGLGRILSERLEKTLHFSNNADITVYMRNVAVRLMANSAVLDESPVGVFLIRDREKQWKNYTLPGIRIYLSVGLLKQVQYENEIAAVLAIELAHVLNRHFSERIEKTLAVDQETEEADRVRKILEYLETPVLWSWLSYSEEEYQKSIGMAVRLVYAAGYDVRGILSVLSVYRDHPEQSPFGKAFIEHSMNHAQKEIVMSSPLLNPVVKTVEFESIRKRIKNL